MNSDTIRRVNATLLQRFGKPVNQCSPDELVRQIEWLAEQLGVGMEAEPAAEEPVEEPVVEKVEYVQGGLF